MTSLQNAPLDFTLPKWKPGDTSSSTLLAHLMEHHPSAVQRLKKALFEVERLNDEVVYLADSLELLNDVYPYVKSWTRLDDETQLLLAYADSQYHFLIVPVRGLYVALRGGRR